jgi:hypothetical protein
MDTIDENNSLNEKSSDNKISLIKILYLWQENNNKFNSRSKILRTIDKNIKLNVLTTYHGNKEILLKPRYITTDPFKNDESLIVMCDIFGSNGTNLNSDKRIDLVKKIETYKDIINETEPKCSFIIKITLTDDLTDVKKNDIIETFVNVAIKGKVNINQYYFENKNTVIFENEFNDYINCADELTFFKYVLFRTSNILNFNYKLEDSFTYKLLNKNSNKEGGLEELKALSDKLNKINVIIPESIERIGYGYLLDNTYTNDVCIYHNFSQILDSLYK